MDTEQIIRLIETVSKSSLTEFEYSEGDMKLVLKAGAPAAVAAPKAPQKAEPAAPAAEEEFVDDGTGSNPPLVGTFYSAPAEDAEPYVACGRYRKEGDRF